MARTPGGVLQAIPGGSLWFLLGALGMILGLLYFVAAGWDEDDPRAREYYAAVALAAAVAAVAYLAMAFGYGATTVGVGAGRRTVYWVRYVDWLLTTPLLLAVLGLLADVDRDTLLALAGVDVAMVVAGLLGALTGGGAFGLSAGDVRLLWWGVAAALFAALVALLLGSVTRRAARRPGDVVALFALLRNLTLLVWAAYPLVWLLATTGTVGLAAETAAYTAIDLAAKVGFGVVLVRDRAALARAAGEASGPRLATLVDDLRRA